MSFRRKDTVSREMDLEAVIAFLRVLLCMSAGITSLVIIGMILSVYAGVEFVVYQMALAVNLVLLVCGGISFRRLRKKCQKLKERKKQSTKNNTAGEETKV